MAKGLNVDATPFSPHPSSETDTTLVGENVDHRSRFWFYDGSMKIRVDGTLYKIHESLLNMYWSPFCDSLDLNDCLEFTPALFSKRISKEDFELLLDFIYPTSCIPDPDAPRSTDDWIRVLAASTSFRFEAPRRAPIAALTPVLSPIASLHLAHKYYVDQWRLPAFRELCERAEMLKLEEARELELEDVLNISHAREMIAKGAEWDSDKVKVLSDQPRSIV
ncbi:hypothetical protein M0805_009532 [Coniferiporia weirii]|nr:hypothetical protein M0805_009532 [Coniferiporia weirii]